MATVSEVTAQHYDPIRGERTKLSSAASATDTTLTVDSTDGFSENDFVIIGTLGQDTTELRKVKTITSATVLTLHAAIDLAHNVESEIREFPFDQVKFYRATTKTGTYTFITGSDQNANVEAAQTTYEDSAGTNTSWYKNTWYNTQTTTETAVADSVPHQADKINAHYATLREIRKEAGFSDNDQITDKLVQTERAQAESEINGYIKKIYVLPLSTIPFIIQHCCELLAAGYLLMQEYGEQAEGTSKDGKAKLEEARGILEKIAAGELALVDEDGAELSKAGGTEMTVSNVYDDGKDGRGDIMDVTDESFVFHENDPDNVD